jgi:cell division septation protein DedD
MRNTDTGEFELVIGNRQLLSGFFIVILLLAVTFAMGYVVGQNSPRSAKLADAGSPAQATQTATEGRPQPASGVIPVAAAPAGASAPSDQQPATGSGQPPADSATATQPAQGTQPTTAAPAPAPAPAEANPPASASTAPVSELAPGSYWQVMALHQADAEVLVRTLKDMGLPSLMSPAPNNLMRVLVGPYNDAATMGRAKSQLENAGFHPIKK